MLACIHLLELDHELYNAVSSSNSWRTFETNSWATFTHNACTAGFPVVIVNISFNLPYTCYYRCQSLLLPFVLLLNKFLYHFVNFSTLRVSMSSFMQHQLALLMWWHKYLWNMVHHWLQQVKTTCNKARTNCKSRTVDTHQAACKEKLYTHAWSLVNIMATSYPYFRCDLANLMQSLLKYASLHGNNVQSYNFDDWWVANKNFAPSCYEILWQVVLLRP